MTRNRRALVFAGGLGALALGASALAQSASGNYELSWRTLSGGKKSDGGSYVVQSAIGQALTKSSSGGAYTVSSGYFAGGQDKYKRYLPILSKDGSN